MLSAQVAVSRGRPRSSTSSSAERRRVPVQDAPEPVRERARRAEPPRSAEEPSAVASFAGVSLRLRRRADPPGSAEEPSAVASFAGVSLRL